MAWPRRLGSITLRGERMAGGDEQLQLDEVEPGDHLGDRVLDLQAGVHLEEGERAVRGQEQLDGAGAAVVHRLGRLDGGGAHHRADLRGDGGGGGLLDDLLVAALQRAIPLEQGDGVAVAVGEHLHLDVAATFDVALDEHRAVTERALRLTFGRGDGLVEVGQRAHDAHAPTAAAGGGLDQCGNADLLQRLDGVVGQHGHAGLAHQLLGLDLRAHQLDRHRGRADPRQARLGDGAGEAGVLGEEAVAGVHRVAVRRRGRSARGARRAGTSPPACCRGGARRRRPRRRTARPRRRRSAPRPWRCRDAGRCG